MLHIAHRTRIDLYTTATLKKSYALHYFKNKLSFFYKLMQLITSSIHFTPFYFLFEGDKVNNENYVLYITTLSTVKGLLKDALIKKI